MGVNNDKPHLWKADVARSVDFYNAWFLQFAPTAFRTTRQKTIVQVAEALARTANLTDITSGVLSEHPSVLPILRMSTAPPLARDRLIGLGALPPGLVYTEEGIDWVWEHRPDDLEQFGL